MREHFKDSAQERIKKYLSEKDLTFERLGTEKRSQ